MVVEKSSLFQAAWFVAIVGGLGGIGLMSTDLLFNERHVIGGHYQRFVETDFAQNLPFRQRSVHLWTAMKLGVFGQTHPDVVIADQAWLFTAEEFHPAPDTFDFAAELAGAADALNAAGIQLVPVIVPDKARIYADLLPRGRGDMIEARYDRSLQILSQHGLPAIDLAHVLNAGRANADTFMRTDTHWSPHGAAIAARAIADAIGEHPTTALFTTDYHPPQLFDGDLMPFVDTGPFAAWTGPAAEWIAIPHTHSNATVDALFDDPDIAIALVGTSYSARPEFNFPGFVQHETGLNLVSFATEGQGPFQPMREALAGGTLIDLHPEIVIWEIPERYIHSH